MAKELVSEELWTICEPLLPRLKKSPKGGRPPVGNREALTGILFVLKTGIAWEDLPQEMGCGSGMTCWRRLVAWQMAGVWDRLHHVLLEELQRADQIDWSRAIVDSAALKALLGGKKPVRTRRIVASVAANTISSPTPKASRWRRFSPGPTRTTSRN
jgi:transposase